MNDATIAVDDLIPMRGIFSGEIVETIGRIKVFPCATFWKDKDSTFLLG
jgi:hypothetical protein